MAEDKQETILADGLYFTRPREGAPDFVKGALAVHDRFVEFMKEHRNESGYVNLDLLESKDGKSLYFKLNTWEPEKKEGE